MITKSVAVNNFWLNTALCGSRARIFSGRIFQGQYKEVKLVNTDEYIIIL